MEEKEATDISIKAVNKLAVETANNLKDLSVLMYRFSRDMRSECTPGSSAEISFFLLKEHVDALLKQKMGFYGHREEENNK